MPDGWPGTAPVTLRVMTYNAHRCVGTDRRHSPSRIAEVIEAYDPDVIALQELIAAPAGSGGVDHARALAERLGYDFRYQPARPRRGGPVGNAILSRLPMRSMKSALLPAHPLLKRWPRSALWAAIRVGPVEVQVINVHLSLVRAERVRQAEALCGGEWLAHPDCRPARILCGDMNASPRCPSYRCLARSLSDAQRLRGGRPQRTWPSLLPLRLIDHLFVSQDVLVRRVDAPRTPLTRVASDHLPLVADLVLRPQAAADSPRLLQG
ncbi:MAG: endonuclease/exonuclease/phosphatase family protein [Planctomycetes bacterium]|nr:endonuclease/exonuclease/phosphatase family protein [Planctomycetota bacterium]